MYFLGCAATQLMLHPSDTGPSGAIPMMYANVADLDLAFASAGEKGLHPHHHQVEGPLAAPHTTRG